MPYISHFASKLGTITLLSDGDFLTGLYFDTQLEKNFEPAKYVKKDHLHVFVITQEYLESYFKGEEPLKIPPLNLKGTSFQKIVFDELLKIPYGTLITYGELAERVAKIRGMSLMSSRAIGHAVGQNPISIIVPCHRVIGAKNKLTGYGGGIPLKRKLLQIEGQDLTKFKG